MLKDYNNKDTITREDLVADADFIADATYFLRDRNNDTSLMTNQEVLDKFMEHMRYQNVNEITALRDLEYAQNTDRQGKQTFARLIDAYDRIDDLEEAQDYGRMMLDYAQGIATAPSTYLGIITGGTGKAAAVAGTQAAKIGVRKILSSAIRRAPSALKAATVEGAIGTGQALAQEETRVETGLQEEIRGSQVALTGGLSALTGGAIGAVTGRQQTKAATKADELYEQAVIGAAKRAAKASEESKRVLANAEASEIDAVRETLNELDPMKVAIGRKIAQNLQPGMTMEAALGSEVFSNIAAATIKVKHKLKLNKGDRVTEGITKLIREGELDEIDELRHIMHEHNLTLDQFSLMYYAEMSEAGRKLATGATVKRALGGRKPKTVVDKLIEEVDELHEAGISSLTGKEARQISDNTGAIQYFRDLDSMRLGLMTSQLATTMRNNLNGGFRIGIDATTRMFDNFANFRQPLDGVFDMTKYALNPYEARVIRQVYADAFPEEAARLFREAADLSAQSAGETALAKIGRKVNVLNTASDNYFKQTALAAALRRRLSDDGKDLYELIRKGELNTIDEDLLRKAVDDAYEFTYQSSFRGDDILSKTTRGFLQKHRELPFFISSFMPFPRFIANQLKFTYEHAPLIGLLPLDRIGSKLPARSTKEYFTEKMPKQFTGATMLFAAYQWRVAQGEDVNWYEFKTNDGKIVDGRPVYGPFAPFMLVADIIYRYKNGATPESLIPTMRDSMQAMLGSTFRTGMGLYALDQFYQDMSDKRFAKAAGETIGNVLNTFTLPAAVVRDFYGPMDERARMIPETREGDYGVDMFDIIYNVAAARAGRSLPPLTLEDPRPARSPFQTGPLRSVNPIEKQIFGFGKREAKNVLQEEMAYLSISPYDIYKRQRNEVLDMYMRQELSREDGVLNLNERMEDIIRSSKYRNESIQGKRLMLRNAASGIISQAKARATTRIEREADRKDQPFSTLDVTAWEGTSRGIKALIDQEYRTQFGGNSVMADRDRTIAIRGRDINVLQWANQRAAQLKKSGNL
jgi:hypothetical protein